MYDGTGDPDDHIAQYKQRMLAVALPKESREATMCKGFGSTLIGPALHWYINLPTRSISSFAGLSDKFIEQFASSRSLEKTSDGLYEILQHRVEPLRDYIAHFNEEKVAVPECSIPTAIFAFKKGLLPDGGLDKELTMYPCKTMEDVLSRAWEHRTSLAAQGSTQTGDREERSSQKGSKDSRSRNRGRFQYQPLEKEEGMSGSTWPDISHLSISTPELVNKLRQMVQQVKWPPNMKAPDSFRNPGLWCDFHRDHVHKTEDCVTLKIEVSGVSHATAKKSTRNAKHGLETTQPKRLLLNTDEISFTAKEQERILTPHHDALVVSLTIANCLVKRILVDNGSSSNIIFRTVYQDLGLEENTLTHKRREAKPASVGEHCPPGPEPSPQHGRQQEALFQHPDPNYGKSEHAQHRRRYNRTPPTSGVAGATREGTENPQIHDLEESDSKPEPGKEAPERNAATESSITAYLEQIFSKRFETMQSMVERLPGVAPPIWRSNPDSYADTPFVEEITSVEMPRKSSFPSIKMYDGTGDPDYPDDHIAQYKQRMLAVVLPKESREATMFKGFDSTLIGPTLQWYINLPTRFISSFAGLSDKFVEQFASSRSLEKTSDGLYEILQHQVAVPECSIPTAISAFKRGLLPDGGLYKELTMYPCKTMEDVLSQAWAQVKWEEDVASRAKAQPKQD
uniref:Retrotransposon gag domain-containing protein n=1 Tax=Brassica oleracea TaxID=3712 RepID=A0A3P6DAG4_BRAOL|nr:unnamed protein product [Brassica oleracea]